MDINTFREAQDLVSKINNAERKVNRINEMFNKGRELYVGDGSGGKFELSAELELKIKHLIKECYWNEFEKYNEEFKSL